MAVHGTSLHGPIRPIDSSTTTMAQNEVTTAANASYVRQPNVRYVLCYLYIYWFT